MTANELVLLALTQLKENNNLGETNNECLDELIRRCEKDALVNPYRALVMDMFETYYCEEPDVLDLLDDPTFLDRLAENFMTDEDVWGYVDDVITETIDCYEKEQD